MINEFTDIHCHMLPGIDDGAENLAESIRMAEIAAAEGIRRVVCTPHATGDYDALMLQAGSALAALQSALAERYNPLCITLGFEVLANEALLDYEHPWRLALGSESNMLLELPMDRMPDCFDEILYFLALTGIRPILAHPERYYYLDADIAFLKKIKEKGVMLQLNAASITGENGSAAKRFAKRMIKSGLADFVATDAHSAGLRAPRIADAAKKVCSWTSLDYAGLLFWINGNDYFHEVITGEKILL